MGPKRIRGIKPRRAGHQCERASRNFVGAKAVDSKGDFGDFATRKHAGLEAELPARFVATITSVRECGADGREVASNGLRIPAVAVVVGRQWARFRRVAAQERIN